MYIDREEKKKRETETQEVKKKERARVRERENTRITEIKLAQNTSQKFPYRIVEKNKK